MKKSKTPKCPECGAKSLPIIYGLILKPVKKAVLGGCIISQGSPTHECRECGHRFGSLDLGSGLF